MDVTQKFKKCLVGEVYSIKSCTRDNKPTKLVSSVLNVDGGSMHLCNTHCVNFENGSAASASFSIVLSPKCVKEVVNFVHYLSYLFIYLV